MPAASIAASGPLAICTGETVTLTAPSGSATLINGSQGGPIAGETNASYNATSGGNYSVIVYNGTGSACTSSRPLLLLLLLVS